MLRSCLILLIAYGLLWAGYAWWVSAMFDPPWLYAGAGVAALLVGGSLGALFNARVAYREWSLVVAARHGLPWSDGRWTAVVGEIHPVAEAMTAPFSGETCVLCEYDVSSGRRRSSSSGGENDNPGSDFTGFLMKECVVRSQAGDVRLLGFPNLVGFGERVCDSASAVGNARRFLTTTPLEDFSGMKLVTIFSAIKAAWTDDDGLVTKNLKLTKRSPEELFSSYSERGTEVGSFEGEPAEDDEEADESDEDGIDSDLEDESDEDLDLDGEDDDEEDLRPGIPLLKEKRVKVGETVCAIGIYSGERRGLVPGGLGADHFIKLIRGKTEAIERQSWISVLGNIFGGIAGLIMVHLIAIGVMAAARHDSKQQRKRQEEAFEIVRSDAPNVARLEKLMGRGVDINAVDGQGRTLLGAAKEPAAIQWLKERGAEATPVLEQR